MKTLHKLWDIIPRAQRRRVPLLILLLIVGTILEVVGIGLLLPIIALLTSNSSLPNNSILGPLFRILNAQTQLQMLVVGFGLIGIVVLVKNVFLGMASYYQNTQLSNIRISIEDRIFKAYLHADYTFHLESNSATLTKNLVAEVPQVILSVLAPILTIAAEGLTIFGIAMLVVLVDPVPSVALIIFYGLCGIAYTMMVNPILFRLGQRRIDVQTKTFRAISETLGGVKQIKVIGREHFFESRFLDHAMSARQISVRAETMQRIPAYLIEFLAVMGLLIMVLTLFIQGNTNSEIISSLGLFVGASFRLVPSLSRISGAAHTFELGRPAIDVVFDEVKSVQNIHTEKMKLHIEKSLEFKNVSFKYDPQGEYVLNDVSFSVIVGQSIGIIGASGAGKTTLVDLLLGLLHPSGGQVLVDGQPIDLKECTWHTEVGYVPQEVFLTDDTIRSNVAFGVPVEEVSESQLMKSLEIAQLSDLVSSLKHGVDTCIGEKGARLSGGQRQRIGIARALYHQPRLLILDEATSALDLQTESEVVETLEAIRTRVTMIVISHRHSSLKYVDRVFRIERLKFEEVSPNLDVDE